MATQCLFWSRPVLIWAKTFLSLTLAKYRAARSPAQSKLKVSRGVIPANAPRVGVAVYPAVGGDLEKKKIRLPSDELVQGP